MSLWNHHHRCLWLSHHSQVDIFSVKPLDFAIYETSRLQILSSSKWTWKRFFTSTRRRTTQHSRMLHTVKFVQVCARAWFKPSRTPTLCPTTARRCHIHTSLIDKSVASFRLPFFTVVAADRAQTFTQQSELKNVINSAKDRPTGTGSGHRFRRLDNVII